MPIGMFLVRSNGIEAAVGEIEDDSPATIATSSKLPASVIMSLRALATPVTADRAWDEPQESTIALTPAPRSS